MKTNRVSPVAAPIVVEGLSKRYGAIRAVDDLSFAVRAGAVTGFLGPNGAGKTTALKMIVGLARPTAGRALIYGSPVASAAADARMLGVHIEPCGAHPGRSACIWPPAAQTRAAAQNIVAACPRSEGERDQWNRFYCTPMRSSTTWRSNSCVAGVLSSCDGSASAVSSPMRSPIGSIGTRSQT
jgi:energy-coupling factor transporter ATP-binding protein EcfA2